MDNQWTIRMIEGSTCDDLSFSASKLVTPEGHALPSHRQRVGENRRARRCVLAIDAVAKMRRKRAAYAPIRAHYHGMITIFWGSTRRARPRRALGRQLSASSTGSRRRWEAELNSIKDARMKSALCWLCSCYTMLVLHASILGF